MWWCRFSQLHVIGKWVVMNHGPSQQSSKEEYKPWKWDATTRCYTYHTKTMLPMRKSVPRSSRQLNQMKAWPSYRDTNCSGMDMSPIHQSGQNHLARHSERGKKTKADRGRGWKMTSGNVQAWSLPSPRGQWRTGENGENWLQIMCGAPTTPAFNGLMMIMMMNGSTVMSCEKDLFSVPTLFFHILCCIF